jgi:hypothetical protein
MVVGKGWNPGSAQYVEFESFAWSAKADTL